MPTKNQIKAYKEVMTGQTGDYDEMLVKALKAYDEAGLTIFDFIDESTYPETGKWVLTDLGFARIAELSDGLAWSVSATGRMHDLDIVEFWMDAPKGFE